MTRTTREQILARYHRRPTPRQRAAAWATYLLGAPIFVVAYLIAGPIELGRQLRQKLTGTRPDIDDEPPPGPDLGIGPPDLGPDYWADLFNMGGGKL